jgi:hypothetical protein
MPDHLANAHKPFKTNEIPKPELKKSPKRHGIVLAIDWNMGYA